MLVNIFGGAVTYLRLLCPCENVTEILLYCGNLRSGLSSAHLLHVFGHFSIDQNLYCGSSQKLANLVQSGTLSIQMTGGGNTLVQPGSPAEQ